MREKRKNDPLIFVASTGLLLLCVVILFSIPSISSSFNSAGVEFTNSNNLEHNYFSFLTPKKAHIPKKLVPAVDTHFYHSLTKIQKNQIDTIKAKVQFLENFPLEKDNTCLASFFESLSTCASETVHIWYYGDSQIEGDRVTQDLRNMLQSRFGGSGLGYIPFSDVATYRTVELKCPDQWIRFNCFNNKTPKGFGFAGKVFKTNKTDSVATYTTAIWISPQQKYSKLSLLYGKATGGKVMVYGKDSGKSIIPINANSIAGKITLSQKPIYGNIQLTLPANIAYHGFLMEGKNGIQVDNCGIRGHSGDGLQHISDAMIIAQGALLNSKLVIFHFGNNMIPYLASGKKLDYYQKEFERLFARYKRLLPNTSILVVSAGDMGTMVNEEAVSYPAIGSFVGMLRNAAINTGCAYFDMHGMMVKDGGIKGWARNGWASIDGHLSPRGQYRFARIMYEELMREYEIYSIMKGN